MRSFLPTGPSSPDARPLPERRRNGAFFVLVLLLLSARGPTEAVGQQSGVQGIISDAATSQPISGASVSVTQSGREIREMRTDRNGLFQLTGIAPGAYRIRVAAFGYTALEEGITIPAGQRLTANRGLRAAPVQLEGVEFEAPASGAVRRELGRQSITVEDVRRIPTPTPSADIVGYLQTLPGVVTTGDRGGQLLIRGGTPSENMVLMDGMLVYQPFHITGFSSVFPEDLIAGAEFFAGGFPAKYSGRVSSVLDVRMRDGSQTEHDLAASVSPFLAELMAEGPIQRESPFSFIMSARRSLIEESSPWLLGEEQPLRFNSYYVKLSSVGDDGASRCSVTALRSDDSGGLDPADPQSRVAWANTVFGGRCASLVGDLFIDARIGYSRIASDAITRGASEFSSSSGRLFFEADASRTIGVTRVEFGGFSHIKDADYDLAELYSQQREVDGYAGIGVYAEATVPVGNRIRLLPGATLTWFPQTFTPTVEPRLRASWQPRGRIDEELSAAVGLYKQPIAGITDRRDAGNVFTAWVKPPGDTQIGALHAQGSWQQSLGGGFSYSLDGFFRRFYDLSVTTWSNAANFTTQLETANGRSHGTDARIELRRGPFYGYAGYGYSWTEYEAAQDNFGEWFGEPVQYYHPSHDRRHQANVLASLDFGRFNVAARWEYGSGFPFTRPIGFDELFDFRNKLPIVLEEYGSTRVLLDRPYNGRMPPMHRLDVSAGRTFDLLSRSVELKAGVINAYDQTNIFFYDVFTNRRIDQLPFAPYASVRLQPRGSTR